MNALKLTDLVQAISWCLLKQNFKSTALKTRTVLQSQRYTRSQEHFQFSNFRGRKNASETAKGTNKPILICSSIGEQ